MLLGMIHPGFEEFKPFFISAKGKQDMRFIPLRINIDWINERADSKQCKAASKFINECSAKPPG